MPIPVGSRTRLVECGGREERRHRFGDRARNEADRPPLHLHQRRDAQSLCVSASSCPRKQVNVEQSGVALRFPPHSKARSVALNGAAVRARMTPDEQTRFQKIRAQERSAHFWSAAAERSADAALEPERRIKPTGRSSSVVSRQSSVRLWTLDRHPFSPHRIPQGVRGTRRGRARRLPSPGPVPVPS